MKNKANTFANCAQCPFPKLKRICYTETGKCLSTCPTVNKENIAATVKSLLVQNGDLEFYLTSLNFTGRKITRLLETVEFAQQMNYSRLGIAFCASLAKEAKIIAKVFEVHGFEVVSAICKVGRASVSDYTTNEDGSCKAKGVLCNPVMQAQILNEAKTDYNIVIGLCVGHDSIFMKYADSMSTVLVAKDRVLGHNPLAVLENIDSFYSHPKKS